MRVLLVHPSALMYSEIFLRLEPLGLERVAAAALADGHDVRLIDLQVYSRAEFERAVTSFQPEAVGFSLNYLANVPEVVSLAKWVKSVLPGCVVFTGGHSVSFVAEEVLVHAGGAIDAVLKGEGETAAPALLAALPDRSLAEVPGAVTADGPGRPPQMMHSLDDHLPARGTARSAAPGPSTAAATAGSPRKPPPRTWPASRSQACSSSTTWRSSRRKRATKSPTSSSAATSASSITWKPGATFSSATRRCSAAGGAWA
jgi:hypothetical protein